MRVGFSWNELPRYAAYFLREAAKNNKNFEIISTKSPLPFNDIDKIIQKKVHWVKNKNYKWKDLNLEIPDIFFQAGWYKKPFISLGKEVKNNGGKVILFSDNQYKDSLRQKIGSIVYRLKYLKFFDVVWVPGKSGAKLMKSFGEKNENIFKGLYASNKKIYKKGKSIYERPKTFLYVGQLIKIKGFVELIKSFILFSNNNLDWKLVIIGNGPLKKIIPKHSKIKHYAFKKPEEISKFMKKSRFLILPSYYDHWPLVVNEAALSGCGLILSDKVGNIPEFANNKNSIICKKASHESLLSAMEKASKLSNIKLNLMFEESIKLGSKFTISNWINNYNKILKYLKNKNNYNDKK